MNKETIKNIYKDIEEKRKERIIMEKQVQQIDREIALDLEKYRNQSVYRVLEYINNKCWLKQDCKNLQNLIVHCLNKLNGNIDGIELSLEEKQ